MSDPDRVPGDEDTGPTSSQSGIRPIPPPIELPDILVGTPQEALAYLILADSERRDKIEQMRRDDEAERRIKYTEERNEHTDYMAQIAGVVKETSERVTELKDQIQDIAKKLRRVQICIRRIEATTDATRKQGLSQNKAHAELVARVGLLEDRLETAILELIQRLHVMEEALDVGGEEAESETADVTGTIQAADDDEAGSERAPPVRTPRSE